MGTAFLGAMTMAVTSSIAARQIALRHAKDYVQHEKQFAACNIDQELADVILAELNKDCLHDNNYFEGDDWDWYLAAGEFFDKNSNAEIDILIAKSIETLNKKGYETRFCCSGHLKKRQRSLCVYNIQGFLR